MANRFQSIDERDDLELEVAWMHFVDGLTQSNIASRRGLSKAKVNRLISSAQAKGLVKVFVQQVPRKCLQLENALIERYALDNAIVAPTDSLGGDMFDTLPGVANAAAQYLYNKLESSSFLTIGIGSGRTIARCVKSMPAINRPRSVFASITGDFAASSESNPFEVINALTGLTGGVGYAFTAPLLIDSPGDREVLLRQPGVQQAISIAEKADFFFVGIGHYGINSFLDSYKMMSRAEQAELLDTGAVADIAGHLLDQNGDHIDSEIGDRFLSIDWTRMQTTPVYGVCSGWEKRDAVVAALKSKVLNGLIVSSDLAQHLLHEDQNIGASN